VTRTLLLIVFCLAALIPGGRAFAHAALLETIPPNGAVLATAPHEIMLLFNEPVAPVAVTLAGRDGRTTLQPMMHDSLLHLSLTGDLPEGSYILSYRVVSADSHPVSGALLFVVGTPSDTAPTIPDTRADDDATSLLVIVNRIVLLASLMFAAGGVLFAAGVAGRDHSLSVAMRRPVRIGTIVGLASALAAIVLQGALLTGTTMMEPAAWREALRVGWQSSLGSSALLMGFGLCLILAFFDRARPLGWLALGGAVLAATALAVSGHAATASPRWLAAPAMALHGLTLCFWAGSLWPLHRALDGPATQAVPLVRRFSRLAVVAVGILLASGLTLAILQLGGNIAALVTTPYGQLLLLKLSLVALLLALAAFNKIRLTPALAGGDRDVAVRMKRSIRLEIAAIGLIVAVTTVLGQTPPPRAMAGVPDGGAFHGGHADHAGTGADAAQNMTVESRGYQATVSITPGRIGRNTMTVALRRPDGAPFDAKEATIAISMPQAGIEPLEQPLHRLAAGRYELTTDALIRPGVWQLSIAALIDDFERITFDTALPVAAP
jgi:copper transport protein